MIWSSRRHAPVNTFDINRSPLSLRTVGSLELGDGTWELGVGSWSSTGQLEWGMPGGPVAIIIIIIIFAVVVVVIVWCVKHALKRLDSDSECNCSSHCASSSNCDCDATRWRLQKIFIIIMTILATKQCVEQAVKWAEQSTEKFNWR